MENAEALRHALQKLADRRRELCASLESDRARLSALDEQLEALGTQRENLSGKIQKGEKAYGRLDGTIKQTEEGYQRVLDTAQTLMDVVSLQIPQLEEELESAC
tara:strand:- start:45 stop:356 length:312 start_codon:yes stop_codon:yes gene_type:complete